MPQPEESPVDRSLAYVASLDPGFPSRIRGASPDDVAALERAAGRPPSPVHRRFLELLGEERGGLALGPVDTRARALREAYEQTPGALAPGYELFAVGTEDPYQDWFLIDPEGPEPSIGAMFSVIGGDWGNLPVDRRVHVAGSVPELLCLPVFIQRRYEPLPLKVVLAHAQAEDDAMARLQSVVEDNGMRTLWFSTPGTRAVEFGDTVLIAKQLPRAPLAVAAASSSRVELAAVKWWLTRDVGLDFLPVF